VDGACDTHGREDKTVQGFGGRPSEDRGIDRRMGSEWILGRLAERGVTWIQLAQDRDRWRDLVNTVMNLRVLAPRS
jgi:hypothetical protein